MSAYLVDAHAVLWFLTDDPQLSPEAKRTMESATNVLLVSAVTTWEIAIKKRIGKLQAPENLPAVLHSQGFDDLPVSTAHAWRVSTLPITAHKDPFDRLLAAQSLIEAVPIISNDDQLDPYGVTRHW